MDYYVLFTLDNPTFLKMGLFFFKTECLNSRDNYSDGKIGTSLKRREKTIPARRIPPHFFGVSGDVIRLMMTFSEAD